MPDPRVPHKILARNAKTVTLGAVLDHLIPMEVVIPPTDDSLRFAGDEQFLAELDVQDSTAVGPDTTMVKTYKYNVDQKYYNWYFRHKLVWKDQLDSEEDLEEGPEVATSDTQEAATEKEGFFKRVFGNLFKKKEKPIDPAVDEPPVEDEEEDQDGF